MFFAVYAQERAFAAFGDQDTFCSAENLCFRQTGFIHDQAKLVLVDGQQATAVQPVQQLVTVETDRLLAGIKIKSMLWSRHSCAYFSIASGAVGDTMTRSASGANSGIESIAGMAHGAGIKRRDLVL